MEGTMNNIDAHVLKACSPRAALTSAGFNTPSCLFHISVFVH